MAGAVGATGAHAARAVAEGDPLRSDQVAIDESGRLLEKYHKTHLYDTAPHTGESHWVDSPVPTPRSFAALLVFDSMGSLKQHAATTARVEPLAGPALQAAPSRPEQASSLRRRSRAPKVPPSTTSRSTRNSYQRGRWGRCREPGLRPR